MEKNISLLCATTNAEKFSIGKHAFDKVGVQLERVILEIDEIQSEDPNLIVRDKVMKAYASLGKPVIVTDDSWYVPALRGFPGPYMKSMNHWFEPEDFLRLMANKSDRSIILQQYLAYTDGNETTLFTKERPGVFAQSARGKTGPSIMRVVELATDKGLTIAELFDKGLAEQRGADSDAWREAAEWFAQQAGISPNPKT